MAGRLRGRSSWVLLIGAVVWSLGATAHAQDDGDTAPSEPEAAAETTDDVPAEAPAEADAAAEGETVTDPSPDATEDAEDAEDGDAAVDSEATDASNEDAGAPPPEADAPPPVDDVPPDYIDPAFLPPPPPQPVGYVVTAIGGVMVVGATITGFLALAEANRLEEDCIEGSCLDTPELRSARNDGRTLSILTDVLLWPGLATLAVGVILLVTMKQPRDDGAPEVGLICTGEGCLGSVGGRF